MTEKPQNHLMLMPEAFCGIWSVVAFKTPDGKSGVGSEADRWNIQSDWITCGKSGKLFISRVEPDSQIHQDSHLVCFKNNNVQFVFLRSFAKPDETLVVQYINGEEQLRCLLSKKSTP